MLKHAMRHLGLVAAAGLFAASAHAADVQFLGQATLKIKTQNDQTIMVDPFVRKNPVTPEAAKDLSTHGETDLILLTHGHFDHIADAPALAEQTGADVALNADMGNTFRTEGIIPGEQLIRFNKGGTITPLDGVSVTMVPAEHSSNVMYGADDSAKKHNFPGGEPAGYVIDLPDGTTLYHAGDTGPFAEMRWIAAQHEPDVAFLPVGDRFTMGPGNGAAAVTELLGTDTVVPIHHSAFDMLTGTPEAFQNALDDRDYDGEVVVMEPGETKDF
ncbi:L-ascorbate metabolism protein UlaG, beta-lactamase superfamily [Limimonas halophila]|uniref:UPF0173 metal-dependent hydrolase SAMN05216241_101443 n=1 Tax=Limimonas halophila TaxID=1082479 RepID=A0A1G7M168_9PROT|nr:metal-dependent hydrolase [Limimonas halophila]SDF55413.1 L-ascorbate metabolism protein UlaG, beta-lactamase superfamily [Limimonas halophila]